MTDARQCKECGAELPLEARPGLCPACRIRSSDTHVQPMITVTLPEAATQVAQADESIVASLENSRRDEWKELSDVDPLSGNEIASDASARTERYVLDRVHSDGGLGRIWLARDGRLNREVALKELLPHQVRNPEARMRFLKEAQITGQLEHPNIVPIYELGRHADSGRPFYTMRFLRGNTLRVAIAEYHRQRRDGESVARGLRRLLNAFVSVCHAVAYAHFRGVVHRDLKPENVVLGDFGQVVLLDWGLAKLLHEDGVEATRNSGDVVIRAEETLATMAGAVMGTPAYMAPEQAGGRGDLIDERTDVYGLGAILFEILTGEAPHAGSDTTDLIEKIMEGETRRARDVEASAPPALDAICRKALRSSPSRRYARASELADEIDRWLADEPVSVYREPLGARLARWARRHRNWMYATLAVVVAVIVVSTVNSVRYQRLAEQESAARISAERLREQGIRGAAKFAARTVATEIDLRWTILEREAADPTLRRLLAELRQADEPLRSRAREALQLWIDARYGDHFDTTKATSWFITDARGVQFARHPFSAKTLGSHYAFRDYFHGQGADLRPEDSENIKPLRTVHRSIVFESQATGNLMTAFSVSIWDDDSVVGVLAMTVELGRFGELQLRFSDDQMAVLIDTKKDANGRQGLILHHPLLNPAMQAPYVDPDRTVGLLRLRSEQLRRTAPEAETRSVQNVEPLPDSFDTSYRDPVGDGVNSGTWLAAFEPVFVRGRPETIRDTGWIVVVQERLRGAGGALKRN